MSYKSNIYNPAVHWIEYFAQEYVGVHLSNLKKYLMHAQNIQYFASKYLRSIYPT